MKKFLSFWKVCNLKTEEYKFLADSVFEAVNFCPKISTGRSSERGKFLATKITDEFEFAKNLYSSVALSL